MDLAGKLAAPGVTAQCIGVGRDTLSRWSHPREVCVPFAEEGGSAEPIAAAWPVPAGRHPESYGIPAPVVGP